MKIAILGLSLFSLMALAIQPVSFTKTVASSGTAECLVALTSTLAASDVAIQALSTNTGAVFVGDSNVTSTGPGIRLTANQAVSFSNVVKRGSAQPFTLKDICVAVAVNGEGVNVVYTKSPEITP